MAVTIHTVVLWKQNVDLPRELGALHPLADEAERLRAENTALAVSQIDTNELERLNGGQIELMRLRGQLALTRKQSPADPEQKLQKIVEAASGVSTNPTHAFNSSANVHIPAGKTLAVGGWSHEPGKRAIALVTHHLDSSPDKLASTPSSTNSSPQRGDN